MHPFQEHDTTIHTSWDHTATVPPLQDHKTICSIEDLESMVPDSFEEIGSMAGEYSIIPDPNTPPVQHRKHRVTPQIETYTLGELTYISAHGLLDPKSIPQPKRCQQSCNPKTTLGPYIKRNYT